MLFQWWHCKTIFSSCALFEKDFGEQVGALPCCWPSFPMGRDLIGWGTTHLIGKGKRTAICKWLDAVWDRRRRYFLHIGSNTYEVTILNWALGRNWGINYQPFHSKGCCILNIASSHPNVIVQSLHRIWTIVPIIHLQLSKWINHIAAG